MIFVRQVTDSRLKLPVFHFSSGAKNTPKIIWLISVDPFLIFSIGGDYGQNGGENITAGQYDWSWRYGSFRTSQRGDLHQQPQEAL